MGKAIEQLARQDGDEIVLRADSNTSRKAAADFLQAAEGLEPARGE